MRNHGTLARPLIETCGYVLPAVNHSPIVYWTNSGAAERMASGVIGRRSSVTRSVARICPVGG
jgi:hypothetical protein